MRKGDFLGPGGGGPPVEPLTHFVSAYADEVISDLTVGNHIKFNNILSAFGVAVVLDTTSPYTTVLGAPSVGRFTLLGSRRYRLLGDPIYIIGSSGDLLISTAWFNADSGAQISREGRITAPTRTGFDASSAPVGVIFVPAVDTKVELRITDSLNVAQIGHNGAKLQPWALVESVP